MAEVAVKGSKPTIAEVMRLVEQGHKVELIDGELVYKTATAGHGAAQFKIAAALDGFNRRSGGPRGPGGWWLMTEVEVLFAKTEEVFRPDAIGFRRELQPERPREWPVRARPDWVAEVLSPSTARYDVVKKQRTLHLHGVPHYWILDPTHETLTVLRHTPEAYLQVLTAGIEDTVRAEPFDAVEVSVSDLFGHD